MLPVLNQGNPEWRNVIIGRFADNSPVTIGSHGCLMTCEAMRVAAYGITETPATLYSKGKVHGIFDIEGNFEWTGMEQVYPTLAFLHRKYTINFTGVTADGSPKWTPASAIQYIKLLLLMGQPVPLEVRLPSQHFVLAVTWDDTRQDFLLHDPNGGITVWFKDRYGDPMTKLTGWIISVGPGTWFPANSTPERQQMGNALGYAQLAARGKDTRANALRAADALLR